MTDKKVIITGATGMVGGCALRICLENPNVSLVTVMGRSRTEINHTKLRDVVVEDFTDYSASAEMLENQDVALFCLGAYTGTVPDDLFREITVDYTIAFAKALHKVSPQAAFCFLSGQGADREQPAKTQDQREPRQWTSFHDHCHSSEIRCACGSPPAAANCPTKTGRCGGSTTSALTRCA